MREGGELGRGPRLGVQDHQRGASRRLAQQGRHPSRMARVGRDHQPAGVALTRLPYLAQLGVGLAQDSRQPVGELG